MGKEPITIGLLAFERRGNKMVLPGKVRARLIADIAAEHQPDLLVCAGHSIRTTKQLTFLASRHAKAQTATTILVEVEQDAHVAELIKDPAEAALCDLKHASHLVFPDGATRWLGRQIPSVARDFESGGKQGRQPKREALQRQYKSRSFEIKGWRCNLICCGEINLIRASHEVRCLDPIIEAELRRANILINPTHDIMGRVALLHRKRRWLSNLRADSHEKHLNGPGGGNEDQLLTGDQHVNTKAYISVSNWNSRTSSRRSQSPQSTQLATLWVNSVSRPVSDISRGNTHAYLSLGLEAGDHAQ